jgi:class 3 adenylate cyclase
LVEIVVLNGARGGAVFALPDFPAILGRSTEAHFQVDDPWISSMHAMFERRGGECWVVDLDSRNGTFLGDERVRELRLLPGTTIRFGRTEVRIKECGEQLAAEQLPEAALDGDDGEGWPGSTRRATLRGDATIAVGIKAAPPRRLPGQDVVPLAPRPVALLRVALHAARASPAPGSAAVRAALDGVARSALNEGGLAVRFAGTGVLAVFGLGGPSADDATRAIRAARAARATVRSLGTALDVRAAVDRGLVLVGNVGGPEGFELAALGEAAERVERVLALAAPGEVLAGPGAIGSEGLGPAVTSRVGELELEVAADRGDEASLLRSP